MAVWHAELERQSCSARQFVRSLPVNPLQPKFAVVAPRPVFDVLKQLPAPVPENSQDTQATTAEGLADPPLPFEPATPVPLEPATPPVPLEPATPVPMEPATPPVPLAPAVPPTPPVAGAPAAPVVPPVDDVMVWQVASQVVPFGGSHCSPVSTTALPQIAPVLTAMQLIGKVTVAVHGVGRRPSEMVNVMFWVPATVQVKVVEEAGGLAKFAAVGPQL